MTEEQLIEVMAELGLGFLLFVLGIEMRFERIKDILRPIVNIALFVAIPDELAAERLAQQIEAVLAGDSSIEDLRDHGEERLERAVEYGPSDVERLR